MSLMVRSGSRSCHDLLCNTALCILALLSCDVQCCTIEAFYSAGATNDCFEWYYPISAIGQAAWPRSDEGSTASSIVRKETDLSLHFEPRTSGYRLDTLDRKLEGPLYVEDMSFFFAICWHSPGIPCCRCSTHTLGRCRLACSQCHTSLLLRAWESSPWSFAQLNLGGYFWRSARLATIELARLGASDPQELF